MSLESSDVAVLADPDEHLLELPGVRRYMISLTGRAFEKALLWRLDWYNFMYLPLSISLASYTRIR